MGAYKLISPPTEHPVVLSELVSVHIKVDDTTVEEGLLLEYIAAATEKVEDYIQRQLMQATWQYEMKDFCEMDCDGYLTLRKAPLVSVTSVKYYDEDNVLQMMDAADYQVDTTSVPGRIRFIGDLPAVYDRPDAVQILHVSGYGAAGATVDEQRTAITTYRASRAKIAILRAVADFYEQRQDQVIGVTTSELTDNIRAFLNPLRLYL